MAQVTYKSGSLYSATPQTNWYLELLVPRTLEAHPSDKPYVIESKYELRPHNLSHDLYGTPDLWWVFQMLNMDVIRDPIYDFRAGKLIFTPSKDQLLGKTGM